MNAMIDFFRTMLLMPRHWLAWIALLIAANAVAPLFFLDTVEGKVVLAAILIGAVVQVAIFARLGFVRFLGMGHILVWVPMLPWLYGRLALAPAGGPLAKWITAVLVLDFLSLLIDFSDVFRYLNGERQPQLRL